MAAAPAPAAPEPVPAVAARMPSPAPAPTFPSTAPAETEEDYAYVEDAYPPFSATPAAPADAGHAAAAPSPFDQSTPVVLPTGPAPAMPPAAMVASAPDHAHAAPAPLRMDAGTALPQLPPGVDPAVPDLRVKASPVKRILLVVVLAAAGWAVWYFTG